jgi:O-antigen/teichoic acid export membrane protein
MTTGLINNLSVLIPIYLIDYFYSTKEVGLYSFAWKIVIIPVTILSTNISQLYYSNLSSNLNLSINSILLVKQHMKIALSSGLIFILPFYVIPVSVYNSLFGSNWIGSYKLIIQFIPFVFILYIATIFQPSYIVGNRLKLLFKFNILLLLLRIMSIVIGYVIFRDFNYSMFLFILFGSMVWYLIFYFSIDLLEIEFRASRLFFAVFIILSLMLLISWFNLF